MNPNPELGRGRVTSIGGATDLGEEAEAVWDIAGDFRLGNDEARAVIGVVVNAMEEWRDVALRNNIAPTEQDRFEEVLTDRLESLRDLVK